MKKIFVLMTALGLALGLMTGCGKSTPLLTAADYEIDEETHKTRGGVSTGDTPETFLAAYGDYDIYTSVESGAYEALDKDEIPFEADISIILPTFFVDDTPIDPDGFCEENELDKAGLVAFLTSEDYLSSHRVIYYYMVFTWENGAIADIRSEYMDYNEDAVFYQEFTPPASTQ